RQRPHVRRGAQLQHHVVVLTLGARRLPADVPQPAVLDLHRQVAARPEPGADQRDPAPHRLPPAEGGVLAQPQQARLTAGAPGAAPSTTPSGREAAASRAVEGWDPVLMDPSSHGGRAVSRRRSPRGRHPARQAQPTAAIGTDTGVPEPSRRPVGSGRSIGWPASEAARAGCGTTQAPIRTSSPRRKRWQRMPAVARPFAGYSESAVTFSEPVCSSGRVPELPATVTTSAGVVTSIAPKDTTRSVPPSLIPATPPAPRPWGRIPE